MDEIQTFGQVINRAFDTIRPADFERAVTLLDVWKNVLCRIKSARNPNEGRNMADHTRLVDVKNGVLLVEADHPGWIELVQLHKKYILTGLRMEAPKAQVTALAFRLAGKRGELSVPQDAGGSVADELRGRLEREERALSSAGRLRGGAVPEARRELPPELSVIFEDLRQSMLTNSKK